MHRETGTSTFELIKENTAAGGRHFWANTTANLFKMSLKDEYDPVNVQEDYMIEDIFQRAWRDNLIDLRRKLEFDFLNQKEVEFRFSS